MVIAGNHDSPSFLHAPKKLLRALNVYVVGSMADVLDDEVIVLIKDDKPEAIVCAVPYLRDKDIRTVEPGETIDDKNARLVAGLKNHYAGVCSIAEQKRTELESAGHDGIPIVAMGHLFTAGGSAEHIRYGGSPIPMGYGEATQEKKVGGDYGTVAFRVSLAGHTTASTLSSKAVYTFPTGTGKAQNQAKPG